MPSATHRHTGTHKAVKSHTPTYSCTRAHVWVQAHVQTHPTLIQPHTHTHTHLCHSRPQITGPTLAFCGAECSAQTILLNPLNRASCAPCGERPGLLRGRGIISSVQSLQIQADPGKRGSQGTEGPGCRSHHPTWLPGASRVLLGRFGALTTSQELGPEGQGPLS